jgi:hypothetical protein
MTVAAKTTAIGVFFDAHRAEEAIAELHRAGFSQNQIGVAARQPVPAPIPVQASGNKAEEAGVAGVLTGGVCGGLLGAGAAAAGLIPGIGPVIGIGMLAAAVSGMTTGAVAGGLVGALIGLGIPEEEARNFHRELEAGRTIVTVQAEDRYDEAVTILRRHGAYGKGSPLI